MDLGPNPRLAGRDAFGFPDDASASGPVDTDVDADESSVLLSASTVETGQPITVTIVARNAAGQGLANKAITSVTLNPVDSGAVSGSGNTNFSGIATRTITADEVGNGNTVTVVCDGVSITQVPTFDVTSVPTPPSGDAWGGAWGEAWGAAWGASV